MNTAVVHARARTSIGMFTEDDLTLDMVGSEAGLAAALDCPPSYRGAGKPPASVARADHVSDWPILLQKSVEAGHEP